MTSSRTLSSLKSKLKTYLFSIMSWSPMRYYYDCKVTAVPRVKIICNVAYVYRREIFAAPRRWQTTARSRSWPDTGRSGRWHGQRACWLGAVQNATVTSRVNRHEQSAPSALTWSMANCSRRSTESPLYRSVLRGLLDVELIPYCYSSVLLFGWYQ